MASRKTLATKAQLEGEFDFFKGFYNKSYSIHPMIQSHYGYGYHYASINAAKWIANKEYFESLIDSDTDSEP